VKSCRASSTSKKRGGSEAVNQAGLRVLMYAAPKGCEGLRQAGDLRLTHDTSDQGDLHHLAGAIVAR
jgi:hypothetical protein